MHNQSICGGGQLHHFSAFSFHLFTQCSEAQNHQHTTSYGYMKVSILCFGIQYLGHN